MGYDIKAQPRAEFIKKWIPILQSQYKHTNVDKTELQTLLNHLFGLLCRGNLSTDSIEISLEFDYFEKNNGIKLMPRLTVDSLEGKPSVFFDKNHQVEYNGWARYDPNQNSSTKDLHKQPDEQII